MRITPDNYRNMMLRFSQNERLWIEVCSVVEGPHGDPYSHWAIASPQQRPEIFADLATNKLSDLYVGVILALQDAEFIELRTEGSGPDFAPDELEKTYARITKDGHDYLNMIENRGVWQETKAILGKVGGSASLDIIKSVATKVVMSKLGLG